MRAIEYFRKLVRRVDGQDMIEYALVAGFLAVTAGATLPNVNRDLESIFRKTSKLVRVAAESRNGQTRTTSPTGQ